MGINPNEKYINQDVAITVHLGTPAAGVKITGQ